MKPSPERFWDRVDMTAGPEMCWPWRGGYSHTGYGTVYIPIRRSRGAHVVAYELAYGPIPLETPVVMHVCDNRWCCNPYHLRAGTKADNSADMALKRRSTIGASNPAAKLTAKQIAEIRTMAAGGISQRRIAASFGISQSNVSLIVAKRRWA